MDVQIGVLVVDNDYFYGIYAQMRVRPRVSVGVYVCVLHYYLHRKLQLVLSTPDLVYDAVVYDFLLASVFCCDWISKLVVLFHDYFFYRHSRVHSAEIPSG